MNGNYSFQEIFIVTFMKVPKHVYIIGLSQCLYEITATYI